MKKALATCLLLATIGGTLFSGVAAAGLKSTGTGWWSYGTTGRFGGGTVYSHLTDVVFRHSTSVKNANGKWGYSGTQPAGTEAKASQKAYNFRTDYAYYRILN